MGFNTFKANESAKRGTRLEPLVIKQVEKLKQIKLQRCGLFLTPCWPVFGASPDAINDDLVVEVKCPSTSKTFTNYITNDSRVAPKCLAQIQLQMLLTGRRTGLFCVASPDFETSKKVTIIDVSFDNGFISSLLDRSLKFWKNAVFPLLLKSLHQQ